MRLLENVDSTAAALVINRIAIPVILFATVTGIVNDPIRATQVQPVAVVETQAEVTPAISPSEEPTPEVSDLFETHFGKEAGIARAIAKAENYAGEPKAINTNHDRQSLPDKPWTQYFPNGSEDYGLMQINLFWNWPKVPGETKAEKVEWIQDPENNIKLAKQIRDGWGNYNAWSTYKSGKYKKYLNREE
jgi:hypothetical protein